MPRTRRRARHRARAVFITLGDVAAVVVKAHRFGFGKPVKQRAAELARIAIAIGVERPAPFPGIDAHR